MTVYASASELVRSVTECPESFARYVRGLAQRSNQTIAVWFDHPTFEWACLPVVHPDAPTGAGVSYVEPRNLWHRGAA